MKKTGKLLDTWKGTSSVKASADVALQAMSALEEPPEEDVIELVGCAKKPVVEDWGVEHGENDIPGLTASLPIGGHLSLISEEDVSRKTNRKGTKKWSEVKDTLAETNTTTGNDIVEKKEQKDSKSPTRPALYRPPQTVKAAKVDFSSHAVFPELKSPETKPLATSQQTSTLSKKKNHKEERRKDDKTLQSALPLSQDSSKCFMVIEEFLKDIDVPSIQVPSYDDEASKKKFLNRKKRPIQEIPLSEYDVKA